MPEFPVQSVPSLGVPIPECCSVEAKSSEGQPFSTCLEEELDVKEGSNQDPLSDVLSASTHAPVMTAMAFCAGVHSVEQMCFPQAVGLQQGLPDTRSTVEQICSPQSIVGSPGIFARSGESGATGLAAASWHGEIMGRGAVVEDGLPHPGMDMLSMSSDSSLQESIDPVMGAQNRIVFSRASEDIAQGILADGVKGAQLTSDTFSKDLSLNFGGDPSVSVESRQQPVTGDQSMTWSNVASHPTDLQDEARVVTQKPAVKEDYYTYMVGRQSGLPRQQQPAFRGIECAVDSIGCDLVVQDVSRIESSTPHRLDTPTVVVDSGDPISASDRGKESVGGKPASRDVLSDHGMRGAFSVLGADLSELTNYQISEIPTSVNIPAGADFSVRLINQVVRAVALRRSEDRTEIIIRLHPPELGSVAVRVVRDTQGLSSHINTSTEEVCNLFQSHLPLLKNALLEAGVNLNSVTVSHDSSLNNTLGNHAHQSWNHQDGSLYQNRRAFYASRGSLGGMVEGRDWMIGSITASSPVDSARYTWLA
ncbi:MAG: flagellar hook-length control protein FliK [Armatimonadota bacterium]